jgi:beta-galactosidase
MTKPEWLDQRTTGVNKEQPRCVAIPYDTLEAALQKKAPGEHAASFPTPYYQSLNGKWKFCWSKNPADRPAEFYGTGFS